MPHTDPIPYATAPSSAVNARHAEGIVDPQRAIVSAIEANRDSLYLDVLNAGAHALRVRSQTHFFVAHRALKFDRAATVGMQLHCPSGSGVRFEPGEILRVRLVRIPVPSSAGASRWRTAGSGEVRQRSLKG